jgi:hypothetical protein
MTAEQYKGYNIIYVRQEGTGGRLTYDVSTPDGKVLKRRFRARADAMSFIGALVKETKKRR